MSRDIRSFFSKKSSETKSINKGKPFKNSLTISSDDSEDAIPSKSKTTKAVNNKKVKYTRDRSKKRAIVSSDEDDETCKQMKNKKAKIANDKKNSCSIEKLVEINETPETLLSKKPISRINTPKNVNDKPSKISDSNKKFNFMNEDDDFDATLNQLDTSQIEDEYMATIDSQVSPHFNSKDKNTSNFKIKEKDALCTQDQKYMNKDISSVNKNINKEKDNSEVKHSKLKTSKNKEISHSKHQSSKKKDVCNTNLEIERSTNSRKIKSENTNYDIITEKIEKKKHNTILYQNYLNRGGARNPGSKEIPEGANQCLANLSFLITGVLESLEREEAESIVKKYGGRILHSVSKKLDYIIIGDEAGPSKLAKAESLGIKKLSEDDFLELIRIRPPGTTEDKTLTTSPDNNKNKRKNMSNKNDDSLEKIRKNNDVLLRDKINSPEKPTSRKENLSSKNNNDLPKKIEIKSEISNIQIEKKSVKSELNKPDSLIINKMSDPVIPKEENLKVNNETNKIINYDTNLVTALVEKYRPKELKQIIGQTGDKSSAKKLQYWLSNWHKNHGKNAKVKPKFSSRDDTGAIYKAALLSGPPGIGKTTTAYVVCAQLGYEVLEFNASDTRSKKLLQEEIAGILSNKTVKSFLTNTPDEKKTPPKHVLLMDEVDGMAGNEDRGGIQELCAFIKSTEVPIICICNDRNCQKIRTLANYTFDLRFQKPRLEQIRGPMMSICFKEGIKMKQEELSQIIQSTNQDIRQVINHIAVFSANSQTTTEIKDNIKYKNLKLGPWEVVHKVFSAEEHKNMNIHDKSDLFFHDYNIAALFVEENYINVSPRNCDADELRKKLAECSESLAIGDTIENLIRGKQAWSLLPIQACFSSVIPGTVMSGTIQSQINFPSWLGKNSKTNKCDRLLQDITVHARITTGASKEAINLDYLKVLVNSIIKPLALEGTEGIEKAIEVMNKYHLTREDLDSLIELTKWPHTKNPMEFIDSKTKTAFTKAYNKCALFSNANTTKKKSSQNVENVIRSDEEQISDNEEDEDKLENDKLIKAKVSKANKASSETSNKTKKIGKNSSTRSKKK